MISSGAGGLVALARRDLPGLEIVAAEIALRDLDDLAGNAGRVVAAAEELDPDEVSVFVEVPYGHGWLGAVEVIEAASLFGKIRTGGLEPDAFPSADQLAQQLSGLIEADLPFKATAGLHRAWPNRVTDERGETLHQHGFLTLLMAVEALIDGAGTDAAMDLLQLDDPGRIFTALQGWDSPPRRGCGAGSAASAAVGSPSPSTTWSLWVCSRVSRRSDELVRGGPGFALRHRGAAVRHLLHRRRRPSGRCRRGRPGARPGGGGRRGRV